MAAESPLTIYVGQRRVYELTARDKDSGELLDLSIYSAMEFEVKAAEGDADPALIAKTLGAGIVVPTQTGSDIGKAQVTISTADTTTTPWPAAPNNVGVFRYDLIGIDGNGQRDVLIAPSDFVVEDLVNNTP